MTTSILRPWTVLAEEPLLSCPPYIDVSKQRIALPDGRTVATLFDARRYRSELEDGRSARGSQRLA